MNEAAEMRVAARRQITSVLEKATMLRLDLLRAVQAAETAIGSELPLLESGEQDLCCLVAALRRTLLDLDSLDAGKMPALPELQRICPVPPFPELRRVGS